MMKVHDHPKLLFGYHGTNAEVAMFDPELGAFFASRHDTAQRYGRNVAAYRIRMENPAKWSPELVAGFQDFLFERKQEGFSDDEVAQFRRSQIRAGCDPDVGGEGIDGYVSAMLSQPAHHITFSDSDPLFGLLRAHLMEEGHDGLLRAHEISDNVPDGAMEYVPFEAHQFAPLLAPEAPAAFAKTKLCNDHGGPLVVYRGEQSGLDFATFDRRKTRENGFFFTPTREIAAGYAQDGEPRAFVIAAERVLDLTQDTRKTRAFVEEWSKSFDEWIDRESGEPTDAFTVLESGSMFDYEGTWSSERWKDLQGTAELAGFDAVILPDLDRNTGVFPAVVVFKPENIWELKKPEPTLESEEIGVDRRLLTADGGLPAPQISEPGRTLASPASGMESL